MKNINKAISPKLCELVSFLSQVCEKFDIVAKETKDENIIMAIRELVAEANQYKQELNSQLQTLKIKKIGISDTVHNKKALENIHLVIKDLSTQKIMNICFKTERSFEKKYRKF